MSFERILTLQQILASENNFIAKNSEKILIEYAGNKIGKYLYKHFRGKNFLFICGHGNNGMDGKIASNFLKKKKQVSKIYEVKTHKSFKYLESYLKEFDIIVDSIFGSGLNRELRKIFKKIVDLINDSEKKVISLDIPSGIECDTGKILGNVVNADITLCMGFFKPAHFLLPGKKYCGKKKLIRLDLKAPKRSFPKIYLNSSKIFNYLPKFDIDVNKYDKGHVLVIGGEMAGASRMVAIAARKIGCGLSTIGILEKHLKFYNRLETGTIIQTLDKNLFEKKDVLVIGPGLGKTFEKNLILNLIKKFNGPIVVDADAISIFKNNKKLIYDILVKKKDIVLTPHEGEFSRLFKYTCQSKIQESLNATKLIRNTILFKGNDTVISFKNQNIWINDNATNSLATAGTGDILCGLISGLLAQKMNFKKAILAAVFIQGELSQIENNLTAEDFLRSIPKIFLRLKNNNWFTLNNVVL